MSHEKDLSVPQCRYHPHHHGSTALQAMTSAGVIIIDGDAKHLNTSACRNIAGVIAAAPEQILFLQTIFFNSTSIFDAGGPVGNIFTKNFGNSFDASYLVTCRPCYQRPGGTQLNPELSFSCGSMCCRCHVVTLQACMQVASNQSNPMNPLCCSDLSVGNGLPFNLSSQNDTALVSGAYQPIITLEVWLREAQAQLQPAPAPCMPDGSTKTRVSLCAKHAGVCSRWRGASLIDRLMRASNRRDELITVMSQHVVYIAAPGVKSFRV